MTFANGVRARNSVWLAPLTNLQSEPDGTLSDNEHRWLVRRARGGFGVVTTCATFVAQDGKAWPGELGIDRDEGLPKLTALAHDLTTHGALGLVQLFHGGSRASSTVSGMETWSASAVLEPHAGSERSREGTEDDIQRAITAFRDGAVRAHRAGFDGVEIHGAHGYLLCQFLSATLNQRTDRWGGALENRARLVREVVRAIRAAVPRSFLVGVRLSPENYGAITGLDLDETAQTAAWLVEDGADFIHLSLWNHSLPSRKYPSESPFERVRAAVPRETPIVVAGQFWSPEEVGAWQERHPSLIALGRSAILNPDWPERAGETGWAPRRPPMSPSDLVARDVSPSFVEYLRKWKGFVGD